MVGRSPNWDEDKGGKAVDPIHYLWYDWHHFFILQPVDSDLQFAICMCVPVSGLDLSFALNSICRWDHGWLSRYHVVAIWQYNKLLGDRLVRWSSKRQKSTGISSTEVEYIALSSCCAQVLWMRSRLTNYGFGFNKILMEHAENGVIELTLSIRSIIWRESSLMLLDENDLNFLSTQLGMGFLSWRTLKTNWQMKLMNSGVLERVNCVLRISGLYTLRLLDAACKKVLNLLKKGLLKVEAILKSAWTEKDQIDNFLKERRLMRSLEKKRFNTTAGNPVKKILLKLNLSITRSDPRRFEGYLKMEVEVPDSS
ncbi:hypothetical protein Tco_0195220 [Tanacetum coccineum]